MRALKNVPAKVLILHDFGKLFLNVERVDANVFLLKIGAVERDIFEQFFHNRMEAARADIFRRLIDLRGDTGNFCNRVFREAKFDALRFEKSDVLLDEGRLRLLKDADEIPLVERFQLDANGEAALQFRNQVARAWRRGTRRRR